MKNIMKKALAIVLLVMILCTGTVLTSAETTVTVTGMYADVNSVDIEFDTAITSVTALTGIELTDENGAAVTISSYDVDGKVLTLVPQSPLTKEKAYKLKVNAGFETGAGTVATEYTKRFIVTVIFSEDWSTTTNVTDTMVLRGHNLANIMNNKLYLNHQTTVYLRSPAVNEAVNYTVSLDVEKYKNNASTSGVNSAFVYNASSYDPAITRTGRHSFLITATAIQYRTAATVTSVGTWDFGAGAADMTFTSNKVTAITPTSTVTHNLTFKKKGSLLTLYKNGAKAYSHNPANYTLIDGAPASNVGYFGFASHSDGANYGAVAIDNVVVTTCTDAPEVSYVSVSGMYADANSVDIEFDKDITSVAALTGISLTDENGATVVIKSYEVNDNVLTLVPQTALATEKTYTLTVSAGTETGAGAVSADYTKKFAVHVIFSEDWTNTTTASDKVTLGGSSRGVVYDNKLWLNNQTVAYLKSDEVNNAVNYTVSLDMAKFKNTAGVHSAFAYNASTTDSAITRTDRHSFLMTNTAIQYRTAATVTKVADWSFPIGTATITYNSSNLVSNVVATDTQTSNLVFKKKASVMTLYKDGSEVMTVNPADYTLVDGAPTTDTGYFGIASHMDGAQYGAVSVDNIIVTTCTEPIEVKEMSVSDVYADVDGIEVEFTEDLTDLSLDMTDIVVSVGMEEIPMKSATVDGNVVTLIPENALETDTEYDIYIPKDFGTATLKTSENYLETIKIVTVYENDWNGSTTRGDGITIHNSAFTNTFNDKLWLWRSAVATFDSEEIATLERYTVKLKFASYGNKLLNTNAGPGAFGYNATINNTDSLSRDYKYSFIMRTNKITNYNASGEVTVRDGEWGFTGTQITMTGSGSTTSSAITAVNADEEVEGMNLTFKKNGRNMKMFKDDTLLVDYDPADYNIPTAYTQPTTGYFCIGAHDGGTANVTVGDVTEVQQKAIVSIDDVIITKCVTVTDKEISVRGVSITDAAGTAVNANNIASQSTVKGQVKIVNYTDTQCPTVVIVAAYGANEELVAFQQLEVPALDANQQITENYQLDNLGNKATKVRVFIWDTFENIAPYEKAFKVIR